jgi:GWxTD domain-containing protein
MNPRAFVTYGADSLSFYLEAYGLPELQFARVSASTPSGAPLWWDTVQLVPVDSNLAAGFVHMPADRLLVGTVHVAAGQPGRPISAGANALVGISSDWPVAEFEEVLSLLRYFGNSRSRQRLREAAAAELSHLWGEFWHDTDPDPTTAGNEALTRYLEDLEAASARFSERGRPGWLTERGEVFLTLGTPDVIRDVQGEAVPGGSRLIRWDYEALELVLYFVSEGGNGSFRLTPTSRVEYSDAVKRRKGPDGG